MDGDNSFFADIDQSTSFFRTRKHTVNRVFQIGCFDRILVSAGSKQSSFVADIRQISADKSGSSLRNNIEIHIGSQS